MTDRRRILILTANPDGTGRLRLDEEVREIEAGLERAKQRDAFEVRSKWAVRPRDVMRAIDELQPQIVHFCGHGAGTDGLLWEGQQGGIQLVNADALADMFKHLVEEIPIKCVLLNACYSAVQAKAIAQHVNYVIGMSQQIGDRSAIEFAVGFYDDLGSGRPFEKAYQRGCVMVRLNGLADHLVPQLWQNGQAPPTVQPIVQPTIQPRESKPSGATASSPVPPLRHDLGNGVTLELVAIRAGIFTMGSNEFGDEKPMHTVSVPAFQMGKHPVTQAQYQAVMGNNPAHFQGVNRSVEQVSWDDAIAFCQKLSQKTGRTIRLPSEAEWEYACRAGSDKKWCFGDNEGDLKNYAWYSANSNSQTHPVGEKKPNAWGLYDMHGNVWEWCLDQWHQNYEGAPTDGSAWIVGNDNDSHSRLIRGGSWFFGHRSCRSACRNDYSPDSRYNYIGFRVVCRAPRTL